jgi:NAD(P)-dependent dehydrogenase (short-subunit alcohol dehydrogenase family)
MESGLFSLSGKTALVTGGSRGIGFALAKGLAEHGADIAIIARTKEQLEAASRQNILSLVIYRIWNFEIQDQERRNTGT